jgi:hypothetical protein
MLVLDGSTLKVENGAGVRIKGMRRIGIITLGIIGTHLGKI